MIHHLSEEEKARRGKLDTLRERGINPYRNGLMPEHLAQFLADNWGATPREELEANPVKVTVGGRIMAFRHFGKAAFVTLKDRSGKAQAYVALDAVGEESFANFKTFDVGDIIYVSGTLFRTKTNELSIKSDRIELLTKSLRPLPEKFHGLTDVEQKYRMRYVDLIMNDDSREVFKARSKITRYIREFFHAREFLEVETPMMHPIAGGAAARPFRTHHNTLDMPLFLRIAPELYLKRLVVGGVERVFEINRNFRNEGMSIRHNPEFTMLEFYWAYATYEDLINITETLLSSLARDVFGVTKFTYLDSELDFSGPFDRLTMIDAIRKYGEMPEDLSDPKALGERAGVIKALEHLGVTDYDKKSGWGGLLERLFEAAAEKKLIQPTFITEFPTETSFLSRANEKNPKVVDRFELYIYGREVANGFSELNDPIDQRQRFEAQAASKAAGNEEACDVDEDFLRALEYGMPPTAGEGIGIDRLVMLLTNQASIRDVILFPQMRPE
jgi:lysyl-tRNA synthetase class 2